MKDFFANLSPELPYSDTKPITQGWTGRFEWMEHWLKPSLQIQLCRGSKNWCMGSLNFDVVFFSLELGPVDLFFAYRVNVTPPKSRLDRLGCND